MMINDTKTKLKLIKESLLEVMREPRRWLLLIGTGTSVALNPDMGMKALAKHLLKTIPDDTKGWTKIADQLRVGVQLETALSCDGLSMALQNEVAKYTSAFVAKNDKALRDDVLLGKERWVCDTLVKHLMRGLSPTWPCLPIVTPNYDMIIEYSCSYAGIPYTTGYYGGIVKRLDWEKSRERQYRLKTVANGKKRSEGVSRIPRVELMKVHGSINLFRRDSDETLIENDLWTGSCPSGYTPLIAPPGDAKSLEMLLHHYNALFHEAENLINKSTAFIVVGYGFNDPHIQKHIIERVRKYNCPLIVLTLESSDSLDELNCQGENVWIITGKKDGSKGTRFVNHNDDLCGDFDGVELWKSDVFVEQILGG